MNDEKALTIQAEQAIADLDPADLMPAGLGNLKPGDTGMPPRLRISQRNRPIAVGDAEAPAGAIVNTLTGEVMQSVEIVPLVFLSRTRVMWPPTFSADNDPECLSDDGQTPFMGNGGRGVTNPQGGPCDVCPWSQFGEDGNPPRCKMQRNFLVLLVESGEPAILTLQSTALKAARHLTTLARTQGLRKSVTFATREEVSDKGRWHVPAFTKGRKLAPVDLLAVVEARNELQNLVITADVEAVEVETEAQAEEPTGVPF